MLAIAALLAVHAGLAGKLNFIYKKKIMNLYCREKKKLL